jgi:hypothetical protein
MFPDDTPKIKSLLKIKGRAAINVSVNVLLYGDN